MTYRRAVRQTGEPMTGAHERLWTPSWPIDLVATLGPLSRGGADPTMRIGADGIWRTTRTPAGPATVHYSRTGSDVLIRAWGPGAQAELDLAPTLLGAQDDPSGFAATAHPVMRAAFERFGAGWRVLHTHRVLEALVPAILEQRVTGVEARRSWAYLVRAHGEPAPGPATGPPALLVAPDGPGWVAIPSWSWHRAGVDPGRARTIVTAAGRAATLERLTGRPPQDAAQGLATLPGIGQWTSAEVGVRAWGDRDAVSFGDFHLARVIVHALTGRTDGTDEQLAEVLRPWAGQRARAVALLSMHAPGPPRRGPKATITDHRGW